MEEIIGLIIDGIQLLFEILLEVIHFICRKLGFSESTIKKINGWILIPFLIIMLPLFWLMFHL